MSNAVKISKQLEISVGLFFVLGMAALILLAFKVSNLSSFFSGETYQIHAYFSNVGSLKTKAPVKMSGVKIGRVTAIEFDPNRFEAKVHIAINNQFNKIPIDSSASIFTAGLLGEQYIGLEPGGDDLMLTENGQLELTQSAMVLEQLIGQFLYQSADKGK